MEVSLSFTITWKGESMLRALSSFVPLLGLELHYQSSISFDNSFLDWYTLSEFREGAYCCTSYTGQCRTYSEFVFLRALAELTLRTDWTSVFVDLHCLDERIVGLPFCIGTAVNETQLRGGSVLATRVAHEGCSLRYRRWALSQQIRTLRFWRVTCLQWKETERCISQAWISPAIKISILINANYFKLNSLRRFQAEKPKW